ncbi:calcitonin gene-related peptide type 1 receptor-like [Mya arenaria]|uniref:calcitonin gene-related peptide type 1 receptor-like n=1 Tax=Mya arenaria TaxID=6604 RepID=UPI0022E808BA|nr:calcitonin gene-related peptide type 1 receptor-like [Mya arenaria]
MYFSAITISFLLLLKHVLCSQTCQSKFGVFIKNDFNIHACGWCYYFLFPEHAYSPHARFHSLALKTNVSYTVQPDINNKSSINTICATLSRDECERWLLCCKVSRDCCTRQLQQRDNNDTLTCPSTWDGYGCWDAAAPGVISQISCPTFLQYSVPTRSALKTCQSDGTWLKRGSHGLDWTDYTPCLSYQDLKVSIYIGVGCQIASLLCLVPSVIIFCSYKSLIRQHRIRLHVNFFISFIRSGILTVIWNLAITHDKITSTNVSSTHLYKNSVECRLLSILKIYFTSTNYIWMFCEGLYLYRLIVNAFSPPKRLALFYILGWGTPMLYSIAYAIVRIVEADESCWSISLGDKEWIIYAPNLFCLLVNVYFLCSILRILLTQLQVHPNEPSNFRKALKATFVLIPLFGVQLTFTVYRTPHHMPGAVYYERFSDILTNSQGLFVAIIFCLCNGEVISLLRHSWQQRQNNIKHDFKKANSAISLQVFNTVTSRVHYNATDKSSPSRGLISCMKMENSEEATDL